MKKIELENAILQLELLGYSVNILNKTTKSELPIYTSVKKENSYEIINDSKVIGILTESELIKFARNNGFKL